VGDAAQLPSVDAGAVLQDLIKSSKFPVCHLNQIFRQQGTSSIILAAHAIYNGEMPSDYDDNFRIVDGATDEALLHPLVDTAKDLHRNKESFQVLAPKHAGILGATYLNDVLRDTLNPQKEVLGEISVGQDIVREGDKVIFTKNDYKLEVFNGDIGIITSVTPLHILCKVDLELKRARAIMIPVNHLVGMVRLAYAVTVHRFQGKEVDHVLLPLTDTMSAMLYRNLVYTAITRAKKSVTIFGSKEALYKAVLDVKSNLRKTLFAERLQLAK
jgi:exodeoxyribonuclease V alpha subunit